MNGTIEPDDVVHASSPLGRINLVRRPLTSNTAGRWLLVSTKDPADTQEVTFTDAVLMATGWGRSGGTIHFDQPHGKRFSSEVRRSLASRPSAPTQEEPA